VAGANMPSGLTTLYLIAVTGVVIEATDSLPATLTTIQYESSLSAAAVNAFLAALYLAFPTRTGTGGTVDLLGGGNAAPGGVYGPACPPTTGQEYKYELVYDSCGISSKHWISVTTA